MPSRLTWTNVEVSIPFLSEVITKNVFFAFPMTLTLTFALFSPNCRYPDTTFRYQVSRYLVHFKESYETLKFHHFDVDDVIVTSQNVIARKTLYICNQGLKTFHMIYYSIWLDQGHFFRKI